MKKYISIIIAIVLVLSITTINISAANDLEVQKGNADALVKLRILKGYEDGSLRLENKIRRSEFITLVIKLMGYDKDSDIENVKITFKDIGKKHWAYNNIKLSIKYNLVAGYPDSTIAPNKDVTYAEAVAVVIRALGYENTLQGNWPDNVVSKAAELKLNNNLDLTADHQLTRGEMSVIIFNALTVKFNK
ncbi:MAG: S-layer homology domain-containing protein [Bacillota bacterium]